MWFITTGYNLVRSTSFVRIDMIVSYEGMVTTCFSFKQRDKCDLEARFGRWAHNLRRYL